MTKVLPTSRNPPIVRPSLQNTAPKRRLRRWSWVVEKQEWGEFAVDCVVGDWLEIQEWLVAS
ncbi:hypothetical protein R11007_05067 [Ralstonia holmesii]|nr:hypothetical protein R11007_05067 [Ralstonia sp. LMG 32967]